MINYLKLVDFEFKRFWKIYVSLIVLTVVIQTTVVIYYSNLYLKVANREMYENSMSLSQYLETYGTFNMYNIINVGWYVLPVGLCAAALIFYCFLIWYRDWFGKNTFIYRLLMLPTARINIYFAKATTIFLMVLGLVGIQLVLLKLQIMIFQTIVPFDLRTDLTVADLASGAFGYFGLIIPNSFVQFLVNYGIGFMAVFVLFTCILFERSYRLKGVIFGGLYFMFANTLFLLPVILEIIFEFNYLYPIEFFILEVVLGLLITAASIWISHYLLNRKVSV